MTIDDLVWEEKDIPRLKRFEKEIPIFCVIREFVLSGEEETLIVARTFANLEEGLRISYVSKEVEETMYIKDGEILRVDHLMVGMRPNMDEALKKGYEAFEEAILMYFQHDRITPEVITYHNIKRFETRLRELPWQEDFEALYQGNGIYDKES